MRDAPSAKSVSLLGLCSRPGIIWCGIKQGRFGTLAAATLEHVRCRHRGCDIPGLPTDPADSASRHAVGVYRNELAAQRAVLDAQVGALD
jgi:hypothetical protein